MEKTYWIVRTHLFRPDEYICSSCKSTQDKAYKSCPACGKRMAKSKTDPSWVDEIEGLSSIIDDD